MKCGAYNAVRGRDAPVEELQYIYDNSKSFGVVVDSPELMTKINEAGGLKSSEHGAPKFIIVLYPKGQTSSDLQATLGSSETTVLTYKDFMEIGRASCRERV